MDQSEEFNTNQLIIITNRLKAGDDTAYDQLVKQVEVRLQFLTRKMLRRFPSVRQMEETGDVMNMMHQRLWRRLKSKDIQSTKEFFHLASWELANELKSLARKYLGANGWYQNIREIDPEVAKNIPENLASAENSDLDHWFSFHETVLKLPELERDIFCLVFYHGIDKEAIAEMYGKDSRTIRRWYCNAITQLQEKLQDKLPELDCLD